MSAFSAMGRCSASLQQYQLCGEILNKELGTDPSAETTQLYQDILAGMLGGKVSESDIQAEPVKPQLENVRSPSC